MTTLSQALERAEAAAEYAKEYADLAEARSIDDFPSDLRAAILSANENIEDLATLQTRVEALEGKSARMELDDADGYLYIPVVTNETISTYFSGHTTAGAVVLNSSNGALYVGTGAGLYKVVADPDAFPGYTVSSTEPEDTTCLWIDTANGNQMKYNNGVSWVTVKNIAVFG